jgi:signal transduction histidine kinase
VHVPVLRSLKFQIFAALFAVLVLLAAANIATYQALAQQRNHHAILNLAGQLQLTTEQMTISGMNYLENAPRDYETYYRDVRLYYQDLMAQMGIFDEVTTAFMHQEFPAGLTGLDSPVREPLDDEAMQAANHLESIWQKFRDELMTALGTEQGEPRLEWAAEYITENHVALEKATANLRNVFQQSVNAHVWQINLTNRLVLIAAVVIAAGIFIWFLMRVLRPLNQSLAGFARVARGDFGHQVTVSTKNEIALLSNAFNHLSGRLNALFHLIDRIQHGSDLNETLEFVSEEFTPILPIDWIGALFLSADHTRFSLEGAFSDGRAEIIGDRYYPLAGTLIEQAFHSGEPLHVPDIPGKASSHAGYIFLRTLAKRGMRDGIFLPMDGMGPMPGVLVFATRQPDTYTDEHLELLKNIAHLVTYSLGRTVQLVEKARLAAIGGFASAIVHELRSPLATISLALDYFDRPNMPEAARKRAALANQESKRMARLLSDILLYAKPLELNVQPLSLHGVISELLQTHTEIARQRNQQFVLNPAEQPNDGTRVMGDHDRLTQLFLNLARNACEASPEGSAITWILSANTPPGSVSVTVHNTGSPIPSELLPRLFEPFFTTREEGTGLGLAIVKQMVDAHGGSIEVESDAVRGTRVRVVFPAVRPHD